MGTARERSPWRRSAVMTSSYPPASDQNQEGRVGKSLLCSSEMNLERADREYMPTRAERQTGGESLDEMEEMACE